MATEKTIIYDRTSRDFFAYLDDEYIGSFGSYHDAETELDRLVYELLTRGSNNAVQQPRPDDTQPDRASKGG